MPAPERDIVDDLTRAEKTAGRAGRFGFGLSLPFRMIGVLWRNSRLWKYVMMPVALTAVIFVSLVVGLVMYAPSFLEWLWPFPGSEQPFWMVLWYVAMVLTAALFGLAAFFSTTVLSGVVASPFNDILSMRAEALFSENPPEEESDEAFWSELLRSLGASIAVIVMYAAVMVPLFVLSFTPAGFVTGPLQVVASAGFVALEFTDTPLSRRGFGFRQRLGYLREHLPVAFGFGGGSAMLMAIPFLGLLTVPLAVLGGTALAASTLDASGNPEKLPGG